VLPLVSASESSNANPAYSISSRFSQCSSRSVKRFVVPVGHSDWTSFTWHRRWLRDKTMSRSVPVDNTTGWMFIKGAELKEDISTPRVHILEVTKSSPSNERAFFLHTITAPVQLNCETSRSSQQQQLVHYRLPNE
jgi:hypothetical protein